MPRAAAAAAGSDRLTRRLFCSMFYQKCIAAWRDTSDYGRCQLVKTYLQVRRAPACLLLSSGALAFVCVRPAACLPRPPRLQRSPLGRRQAALATPRWSRGCPCPTARRARWRRCRAGRTTCCRGAAAPPQTPSSPWWRGGWTTETTDCMHVPARALHCRCRCPRSLANLSVNSELPLPVGL